MSKILTKLKKEEIDEIENYSERMNSLKALALAFETDEVFSKKCDMYERLIKDISDTQSFNSICPDTKSTYNLS